MTDPNARLKSFVERVERIEEEIKASNSDKSETYAEAKSEGFDVKALKVVIAKRRKSPDELSEHEAIVETYWCALNSGTVPATRARTTPPIQLPSDIAVGGANVPAVASSLSIPDDGSIPDFLRRTA